MEREVIVIILALLALAMIQNYQGAYHYTPFPEIRRGDAGEERVFTTFPKPDYRPQNVVPYVPPADMTKGALTCACRNDEDCKRPRCATWVAAACDRRSGFCRPVRR